MAKRDHTITIEPDHGLLEDPSTSCVKCAGTGRESDITDRGTWVLRPCFWCGGSGNKSVRTGVTA